MSDFLIQFAKIFPEMNLVLGTGIMIFIRLLGMFIFAPVFNRKEIPSMVKISMGLIMTVIFVMVLKPAPIPDGSSLILCMVLNFAFGALIGFVANCILAAVAAGGDMMNMQMGASSATVLDPTTKSQVSIIGNMFGLLALVIFLFAGGVYWLFEAFLRSFELLGLYPTTFPMEKIVNLDYLVFITSNILYMGMQIASPILLATLGQDIILGIISKTAPQVNVFQLSFLFKPCMGALILVWILPMLINVINDYINSFAQIF